IPDGKGLALGGEFGVLLFETATGRELRRFGGRQEPTHSLAFAPDGRTLATSASGGLVRLWRGATGEGLCRIGVGTSVRGKTFLASSPNGKLLAVGHHDKTVRLCDAITGKEIRRLAGHEGAISSVAFSADSRVLASASKYEIARLWDVENGKQLHRLGEYQ